jgi:hypothetical protein
MKHVAVALAALAAATALTTSGGAAGGSCGVTIKGGTSAERAVTTQVVCRMRGSEIGSIRILEGPPDAPTNTLWLAIYVPRPKVDTLPGFLIETREKWDAAIAAAAIRDSFVRARLRRVVAYQELWPLAEPNAERLYGIALPAWGIKRWETGAPSRNLGRHAESWPVLQAKLNALSRRYHVKTTLVRFEPLAKAPLVWIWTPQPGRFVLAGGFDAYKRALHFGQARYEGVFIVLVARGSAALAAWAEYRGRQGEGCGGYHRIRGADRICPSQ